MRHRHGMAIVAGFATLLATLPLASIFESWAWLVNAVMTIAAVIGTATVARVLRAPAGVQVLAGMGALLIVLTLLFPSGQEIAGLIPTAETFRHFTELLQSSGDQIRRSAIPVPDLDGLLLLSTAGIGLMAVLIDLAAVGIRRPALAGLPMLALYSVPVAVMPNGVSFLSFVAAGAGFLWLLVSDSVDRVRRFGRRFSGEGRDVDIWEPSPLSSAGRRLGAGVIAAAILLPLAVPAMTPTLLSNFGPPGGDPRGGGGPDTGLPPVTSVDMNALLRDNLTLNEPFDMVVVRTDDTSPFYLRLGVGERVDSAGFHSDLPTVGQPVNETLPNRLPFSADVVGSFRAHIEIKGLSGALAPVYGLVTAIEGLDGNWGLNMQTESVYSRSRNISGSTYVVEYARLSYTPDDLRGAAGIPVNPYFEQLTQVPASAFVANEVAEVIAGLTTQYDRVRALHQYFSSDNGFIYTTNTGEQTSNSPIVDFLRNQQGFCVQYAAAMAWMVREAGYPARVAFGFTKGSGSRNGVYTLTNRNLHAWTEVYFEGFGWVPFDATPGSAVPGTTSPIWAPDNSPGPQNPTTGPTPGATGRPNPDDPNEGEEDPTQGAPGVGGISLTVNPWYVVAGATVLLLLVLLAAPGLQRRARRRRRLAAGGGVIALTPALPGQEDLVTDPAAMSAAQRDAHNAWAELLDLMIDYGVLVDPAETPRTTAGRLAVTPQLSVSGRPATVVLARAEERARYAPAPVRATSLDDAVRQARQAFAEDATRWQQLNALLFPRSVLMRWRLSWYGLAARTARTVGRARDIMLLVPLRERRRR